ncbi:oligosaccharide flippase family protein [Longimicrobium terrae]|uniref:O-antigen/teichoic acid export membrane protein n=1 Tax=Longimicrobium terrae TaxID=1639882 RepID=A0A841GWF9_9BACT|nr:O-antigen/teichoic acid export membrane protein [Longimicrobium terrae]MBB6068586.1 O-antigen/teichoic acid export membrane protein [Longimicrobium terrae]NNC27773.1 oligosaccharide flippase family protein [Longimicrobium terrae]
MRAPGPLRRGVVHNLLGIALPALVALIALPRLAAALGTERLGVLTLVWATLSYFGVLNLGVGRALTQAVAGGEGEDATLSGLFWTGLAMVMALAASAGAGLALAAPWLARGLNLPPGLAREAADAFRMLGLTLPWVISFPVLTGVLEARYRFGRVNAVAAPASALAYLGPVFVASISPDLLYVTGLLAVVRMVAWTVCLTLCLRELPALRRPRLRRGAAGPLLRFGGWTTVSAAVSPVLVYLDRFVLGGLVSTAAVAFYGVPQEITLRLGAVSSAIGSVLFPAFAAAHASARRTEGALLRRGMDGVFLLVLPAAMGLAAAGGDVMRAWMGADFAREGGAALAVLGVGLLMNGFGKVASSLLYGAGRPDHVAHAHLLELVLYVPLVALLVWMWGVPGAALAWTLRTSGDALLLLRAAGREVPEAVPALGRAARMGAFAAAGAAGAFWLPGLGWRVGFAVAATLCGWAIFRVHGDTLRAMGFGRSAAAPSPGADG